MCLHQGMFTSPVNPHFLLALKPSSVHDWFSFFRVKIMQSVSNSDQNHISSAHLGPGGDARKCFNGLLMCHRLIVTKMLLLITRDGVPPDESYFCLQCFVCWIYSAASCFCTCVISPKGAIPPLLMFCRISVRALYWSQFQTFPSELIRWEVVGGIQADSINILSPRLK